MVDEEVAREVGYRLSTTMNQGAEIAANSASAGT
jgi:hypothetical protein